MFEPYFTTKPDGHGLGMMIINAIVRAHDGNIDIQSKEGSGTMITVSIPRSEPAVKMLS
jgi:signal transduction histidine kinase